VATARLEFRNRNSVNCDVVTVCIAISCRVAEIAKFSDSAIKATSPMLLEIEHISCVITAKEIRSTITDCELNSTMIDRSVITCRGPPCFRPVFAIFRH